MQIVRLTVKIRKQIGCEMSNGRFESSPQWHSQAHYQGSADHGNCMQKREFFVDALARFRCLLAPLLPRSLAPLLPCYDDLKSFSQNGDLNGRAGTDRHFAGRNIAGAV
jgi:hypothetical protein